MRPVFLQMLAPSALLLTATAVVASPPMSPELQLTHDLTSQFAATMIIEKRLANSRQEAFLDTLETKDRKLRRRARDLKRTRAERDAARTELAAVIENRRRLIEEITQRDRTLAAEVAAYRDSVRGLADSKNPELRAAVQRYADGERRKAYAVIDRIIEAENRAVQKAADIKKATRLREKGSLALDMKRRGEMKVTEALVPFERAQRLDPEYVQGWLTLSGLYLEAGRARAGTRAAEYAFAFSSVDQENVASLVALAELGTVSGRFEESKTQLEEAVRITRESGSEVDPGWRVLMLIRLYRRLAVVSINQGNHNESIDHQVVALELAVPLLEDLLKDQSTADEIVEVLSVSSADGFYAHTDDLFQRLLVAALENVVKLVRQDYTNTKYAEISARLQHRLGRSSRSSGDFSQAKSFLERAIEVMRILVSMDPSNIRWRLCLALSYMDLADLHLASGEHTRAISGYSTAQTQLRMNLSLAPGDRQSVRLLAKCRCRLAQILYITGSTQAALQLTQQVVETKEGDDAILNQYASEILEAANCWKVRGDAELSDGQASMARRSYGKSLALMDSLVERHPTDRRAVIRRALTRSDLSNTFNTHPDHDLVLQGHLDGLDEVNLVAAYTSEKSRIWHMPAAIISTRLAAALFSTGHPDLAQRYLSSSIEILDGLLQRNGSDYEVRVALLRSLRLGAEHSSDPAQRERLLLEVNNALDELKEYPLSIGDRRLLDATRVEPDGPG